MNYYNSETVAHLFFYGVFLSIYLGLLFSYKVGENIFILTYALPFIVIPFAIIHVLIYRIHIEFSLNLDNLTYWEIGFYIIALFFYSIYSAIARNNFYYFLTDGNKIDFLHSIFITRKKEFIPLEGSHKDNLIKLIIDFKESSSIYIKPFILFFYIFIVFLFLKNTDKNLYEFFYLIEYLTNGYDYLAVTIFSLINSIVLFLLLKNNSKNIFRRIYEYVNFLRLEGQYVFFTKNEDMKIDCMISDIEFDSHFNSKTYYYFLNLKDEGIWYYFHPNVDYSNFNEIIRRTSHRSLKKFYLFLKEINKKHQND